MSTAKTTYPDPIIANAILGKMRKRHPGQVWEVKHVPTG